MTFVKGYKPTDEHKKKLSEAAKKRKPNFLGHKHSEETKKKWSELRKGKNWMGRKFTDEEKIMLSKRNSHYWLGKKKSLESRMKQSESMKEAHRSGRHPMWKGGVTKENISIRHSLEYKLWRESVFTRDDFTCRFCGERGGRLNADHIKPFALFPELRFAIDNGRTLCVPCHQKTPTYLNPSKKQ